jgi:hypothetical protein
VVISYETKIQNYKTMISAYFNFEHRNDIGNENFKGNCYMIVTDYLTKNTNKFHVVLSF